MLHSDYYFVSSGPPFDSMILKVRLSHSQSLEMVVTRFFSKKLPDVLLVRLLLLHISRVDAKYSSRIDVDNTNWSLNLYIQYIHVK